MAARQAGVVAREQALAAGVTRSGIAARVRRGRWQQLLRGVYATFTGPPPRLAWLWAVVLRAGPDALLSHETAAEVSGLTEAASRPVHVSVPGHRRVPAIPGAVIHRRHQLPARHPVRQPPQTRVEQTVLDLVDSASSLDAALGWVTRACAGRFTTAARLRAAIAGRRRLRWRPQLTPALAEVAAGAHSVLELRYARDVERAHGLPRGVRQALRRRPGGRWYDDVHYRGYRTRVELDGRTAHPATAWSRDRRRDNAAVVAGDTVLRYGWSEATGGACGCAAEVALVLRRQGWDGAVRACRPGCPVPGLVAAGGPAGAH